MREERWFLVVNRMDFGPYMVFSRLFPINRRGIWLRTATASITGGGILALKFWFRGSPGQESRRPFSLSTGAVWAGSLSLSQEDFSAKMDSGPLSLRRTL